MKKRLFVYLLFSLLIYFVFPTNLLLSFKQNLKLTSRDHKIIISKINQLMKENYIFPEISEKIEEYLQNEVMKKKYKDLTDPVKFAHQITSDLREINQDRHLAVWYNPQQVLDSRKEESKTSEKELKEIKQRRIEKQRRFNFGFRKVENLVGNVGYLDLRMFRSTDYAASTALGAMNFLANSDAIIIDLRNNYGGGASMYLLLVSMFFDSDPVHLHDLVDTSDDSKTQYWTLSYVPGKRLPDIDLFILTSKKTFSAAEQFTYDLQSLKRAIVVGETTGGGAHMTNSMAVDDNFMISIPFAGSMSPITKTNWEGIGIQPDIRVKEDDALKTAHLLALKAIIKKSSDMKWKKILASFITEMEKKEN